MREGRAPPYPPPLGTHPPLRTALLSFCSTKVLLYPPGPCSFRSLVDDRKQAIQLFDFSERKQSNAAAVFVDGGQLGGASDERLLVTRVGDALQEPFWPEGLGVPTHECHMNARAHMHARARASHTHTHTCTHTHAHTHMRTARTDPTAGVNRGFYHVLDCAELVRTYARYVHTGVARCGDVPVPEGETDEAAAEAAMLKYREGLFNIAKGVRPTFPAPPCATLDSRHPHGSPIPTSPALPPPTHQTWNHRPDQRWQPRRPQARGSRGQPVHSGPEDEVPAGCLARRLAQLPRQPAGERRETKWRGAGGGRGPGADAGDDDHHPTTPRLGNRGIAVGPHRGWVGGGLALPHT